MTLPTDTLAELATSALAAGRDLLLEHEGYALLQAVGLRCPRHAFVRASGEVAHVDLARLSGSRLVVKVVSPEILHKSDFGGVAVVAARADAVAVAIDDMAARLRGREVTGFLLCEFVEHVAEPGAELLVGLRWVEEFGPVLTIGAGGVHAEFLAGHFRPGEDLAHLSPSLSPEDRRRTMRQAAIVRLALDGWRDRPPHVTEPGLAEVTDALLALGVGGMPAPLVECEINPLVLTTGGPVALDVIVRVGRPRPGVSSHRPLDKLKQLLEPRSIALVGVSEQLNPGHIILNNLLREGFDPAKVVVVKPGATTIEGCHCVPDVASVPGTVDLLVLAVSAAQVPGLITDVVTHRKAETLIVIPGGLEEKSGTGAVVARMHEAVAASRLTSWRGPLINGGNCLGIQSRPGRYDTMFIPEHKLPAGGSQAPVAVVSQSGAFAVARASKLVGITPKFTITAGNQMDVTVGEYLTYLEADDELEVFAVYVEGFKPLDGRRFLESAARIVRSGRTVVLYRAGRSAEGARASASHTASIAGDYAVTRGLAAACGVVVADTLEDFEDLVRLFTWLRQVPVAGRRLAAVSNAGFECVAMADNLRGLELATFGPATVSTLRSLFQRSRIDSVVDVHNPLDLTPMTGDAAFEQAVDAVMADPDVDVGAIGCVPLTGALSTLAPAAGHREDVGADDSVARRLTRLKASISKPWVAVVDAGALYDPMARLLESAEIPTFRAADRAIRLLGTYCSARLARCPRSEHESHEGTRRLEVDTSHAW